eukprot:1516834-Rhodomonas_salina.7
MASCTRQQSSSTRSAPVYAGCAAVYGGSTSAYADIAFVYGGGVLAVSEGSGWVLSRMVPALSLHRWWK